MKKFLKNTAIDTYSAISKNGNSDGMKAFKKPSNQKGKDVLLPK